MTQQQIADMLLHHKRLLWWMKREDRDRELMKIADDIIFAEQLHAVTREMEQA
jgi:hypothetical protein